jgi:hypothetical protein
LGPGQGDVQLDLGFPRMQVLGADVATDLRGVGLWGEAGVFWPEEVTTRTVVGASVRETVALGDVPYVRFTVGGDYTFPGGLYVNIQWMRGFFTERGRGNLHDYLIGEVERDVLRSDIKLSITGGWEVGAWDEVNDSQGYFLTPELTYQAIDNLELQVGLFFVEGAEESLFGQWEQIDQVYLRARVSF